MTEPATDDMVDTWERQWRRRPDQFVLEGVGPMEIPDCQPLMLSFGEARSLIARIKSERDRTIRECAELSEKISKDFLSTGYASIQPSGSFLERFAVDEYRKEILALLESKP